MAKVFDSTLNEYRLRYDPVVPNEAIAASIRLIEDLDRLGRLAESLLDVAGWDELLATP